MAEGPSASERPSTSERLASAYKRLASSAEVLNAASDEFAKPISELDRILQKLNIGLITWERVVGGRDSNDDHGYWRRDIGYSKVGSAWGLAIRTVDGHDAWEQDEIEQWLFNDAPRSYRIEALEKLPDLLEELIKNADKTAKKLTEKTVEANELATALKQAAEEVRQERLATRQQARERK